MRAQGFLGDDRLEFLEFREDAFEDFRGLVAGDFQPEGEFFQEVVGFDSGLFVLAKEYAEVLFAVEAGDDCVDEFEFGFAESDVRAVESGDVENAVEDERGFGAVLFIDV